MPSFPKSLFPYFEVGEHPKGGQRCFHPQGMLMNWLLYGTLLIGVHFGSLPSVVVTILAYMVLLAGYFKSWSYDEFPKIRVRP